MFLLKQILPATILAMAVAAGICGIALAWGTERARSALAPLAMGVAYFVGHLFIVGWVRIPPSDTTNWLPFFALASAVLGAGCTVVSLSRWTRALIFALVSAGALTLLLKPKFQYGWSLGQSLIWVAGLACAMVLLAVVVDGLTWRPAQALEMPVILLATCAGTFGALMLSGSVLLAQFAAVLGGAVFGSLVLSARNVALGRGIVPLVSLLLGALLVSGYFFAELPATAAVLLGFAPIFALIPIYPQSKLLTLGVRAATVVIPILLALFLAFRASPSLDY
ncbi:MAG: hypothetical protein DMF06_01435 [Verrucomicrobia bacterium]|nr:MAG: hypothetical protein DMF06_01435 [Verrucomicrobiota bacterium]